MSSKSLLYHPWLVSSLTALSSHTLRRSAWPMFLLCLPLWGSGLSVIFSKFLHDSILFRKIPFDHSFLSEGIGFSVFLNSFFYHPSLLSHSMLLGGGGCCVSNYLCFIFLYCSVTQYFERGQIFYVFEKSLVSSLTCIIPDCSIISYFEGVGLAYVLAMPPSLREWIISYFFKVAPWFHTF